MDVKAESTSWRKGAIRRTHYLCVHFTASLVGSSDGKESTCNAGNLGSIPGLGRSPGEGKGYPLQYFGLENSMDCIVHGVTESDMTERLSLTLFWCKFEVVRSASFYQRK